jgi:hypothetical protein
MENYFSNQRDHIFRNVEVLIYVFDVESSCAEVLPPLLSLAAPGGMLLLLVWCFLTRRFCRALRASRRT